MSHNPVPPAHTSSTVSTTASGSPVRTTVWHPSSGLLRLFSAYAQTRWVPAGSGMSD